VKTMRAKAFKVDITGDPAHELNFLTKKGMSRFLADPLFLLATSIQISVVCSLFANALPQWRQLDRGTST